MADSKARELADSAGGGGGGGGTSWTAVETLNPVDGTDNTKTTTATIPDTAEEFLVVFDDASHNSGASENFYVDFPDVTLSDVEGWTYNNAGSSTVWSGHGYPIGHTANGTAQHEIRVHGIRVPGTNRWSVTWDGANSLGTNPHYGHGNMTSSASALGAVKVGIEDVAVEFDNSTTIHVAYK